MITRFALNPPWQLFVLLVLGVMACDGSPPPEPDVQLIEINNQFKALQAENRALIQKCSELQDRLALLEAEHENLQIKEGALSQWSRQLAAGFGPGIWYFGPDERPLPVRSIPNATPTILVTELNRRLKQDGWPRVILEKIEGHTAYIRISNEQQLTQNMGTTGATALIEAITFTLTSLESLDFVEFQFKEGDHAIPGRYSR